MDSKIFGEVHMARFPYILVTLTGARATDDNISAFIKELDKIHQTQDKVVVLFDFRQFTTPAYKYQLMLGRWINSKRVAIQTCCLGTAFVMPNPTHRLILKNIFKIFPPPTTVKILNNFEEGEIYLQQRLRQPQIEQSPTN